MEQLIEFALFFGKVAVVFISVAGIIILVALLIARQKLKPELEVDDLNSKFKDITDMIKESILNKKEYKEYAKALKKEGEGETVKKTLYVLKFEGDVEAKAVDQLRDEVTAVLAVAKPQDDVLVSIESPGGTVHGYGLGAAQLQRLKSANLNVVAAVDKVAASGGYLMACVCPQIIAAPFAIIGSIGVLAQVPNVHRLLKKHDVDYEEITAGEYKRTISMLGEITEKGRAKFQEQIQDTHELFKSFVKSQRPQVDISKVATGEYWFATRAKDLGLVDQLQTSDDFILSHLKSHKVYKIKMHAKKKFGEKLQDIIGSAVSQAAIKIWTTATQRPWL